MKPHKPFVHLHVHSHYSVLDGMIKIPDLIKAAKEHQFPAIALTEHGNMFSAMEFYNTAVKEGIKPIIGMEAYVAPESRTIKEKVVKDGKKQATAYHLTLLVKNFEGYQNLLKLSSIGFIEGFYYNPRIDKEILRKHNKGLIALSGCIKGEISDSIIKKDYMHARRTAYEYKEIFGDDFYMELQFHKIEDERTAAQGIIKISKELNIPIVATNDVHYLAKDDYEAHEILLCMQTQKKLDDEDRMKLSTNEFNLKSYEEMSALFSKRKDAIENTITIMEKCHLELELGKKSIPRYPLPEEIDPSDYLEKLAREGLKKRYHPVTKEIKERLEYELDIIEKMSYVDYFLITWDYINFARKNNIAVGPGRGSSAASILAYALGITNVDPIKYGLFFERFLNPDRISPPDIDVDFEDARRDEVIDYVFEKYGKEHTSHIITFNKFKARAAFKAVARVLNIPFSTSNSISKLIDQRSSLTETYKTNRDLRKVIDKDEGLKKVWEISLKIEDICSSVGTHAAGIVISEEPLVNFAPFYMDQKERTISIQFDLGIVEPMGLKFDFLGLKNLSIIKESIRLIKETENIDIDIDKIPLNDKNAYRIMHKGLTKGIFQIESTGLTELFCKLKPRSLQEICILIGLHRPGPMRSGMMESYSRRRNGLEPVKYLHESLKDNKELVNILKETLGVVVYQEQVMGITRIIGGFSLGEADLIRRAMGKKKLEILQEQKARFLKGAKNNNFDSGIAESVFTDLAKFAEYGFPKAHSISYAFITYQTAYLKANYTAEFLAGLFSNEMDKVDNISKYYPEARKFKIDILPPDINKSIASFNVAKIKDKKGHVKKVINFGLAGIKNIGEKLIEKIVEERQKKGEFRNIMDFLVRLDSRLVNKKVLEGLIKAGAMDSFNLPRKTLFDNMEVLIDESSKVRESIRSGQMNLFIGGKSNKEIDYSYMLKNIIKEIEEWPREELLKNEKEVLGLFLSGHPLNQYKNNIKKYTNINLENLEHYRDNSYVSLVGLVSARKVINVRDNKKMAFLTFEDLNGHVEVVVKPELLEKIEGDLQKDMPIFICRGYFKNIDDQFKIDASEIVPVNQPEKLKVRKIHIKISYAIAGNEKTLFLVRELLKKHKGDVKVFLHIYKNDTEKIIMEMPNFLKVKPDKFFLTDMVKITGEDSIYLN